MKLEKKFKTLFMVLVMSVTLCGCGLKTFTPVSLQNLQIFSWQGVSGEQQKARNLFLKTWRLVSKEYYDPSMNKQDWDKWRVKYYDSIKTLDDSYIAIDSMLESLNDPYSRFLKPSDYQEQNMSIDSKIYGIGVNISSLNGKIIVVNVISDTPAEESGLKVGDYITAVDGKSVKGYKTSNVADLVRGKAGSSVNLSILRGKNTLSKNVTRREIHIRTVESKVIDKNIGYIKISSFISQDTNKEMLQAIQKTLNTQGLIIDLRGNTGGLLPNAIFIANLFVPEGVIVSIVDKNNKKTDIKATDIGLQVEKPVVILINEGSASASEILSGALKDHKKAILVGETTFGKGLVQQIVDLPEGAGMNVTVAKYLTPKGTDINKKGIKPDVKVDLSEKDFFANNDTQLKKAKLVLKQEMHSAVASK